MIVARMGSHCILLLAIAACGQTSSGHDSRTFVLFSHKETTWNHAHEICEENGMSMITVDSVDVYTALKLFRNKEWTDWDHFWTGLHNIGDKTGGDSGYVWASCEPLGTYRPWRIGQTHGTELCIRGYRDLNPSYDWQTKRCGSTEGLPLCEKVTGSCGFREMKHTNVGSTILTPQTLNGIMTYNECLSACVNYQGVSECWGFTVNSDCCSIYESDSFTEIIKSLTDEQDSTFYAKICFKGVLNRTSYSSKYGNKDDPFKGCTHAYSQPNTDTTVITEGVRSTQVNTENTDVTTPEIETTPYETTTGVMSSDRSDDYATTSVTSGDRSDDYATTIVTSGDRGIDYATISVTGYNGLADHDTNTITRDSGMNTTVTATGGTSTRETSAGSSTDGVSSTGYTEAGIITSGSKSDTGGTRTGRDYATTSVTSSDRSDDYATTSVTSGDRIDDYATTIVTSGDRSDDYATISVTGYNGLADHDTNTITRDSGMNTTVTATGGTSTRETSAGSSTDGVSSTGNTEAGIITSGPETDTGGTRTEGDVPGGLYAENTIGGPGSGTGDTQSAGPWDTKTGVPVTFTTKDSSAHSSSFVNIPVTTSATTVGHNSAVSDGSIGQVTENCRCVCKVPAALTVEERQTLMDEIIRSLTINKKNVSVNVRRYVSAEDNRPSAVAAGGVGIAVLSIVFGGLFLLDVAALKRDAMNLM